MRPTLLAVALALASLLAPARARADGPAPELHLTAGIEIEGTSGITSVGFRGQALVGTHFGTGRLQPSIAAGVVLGTGAQFVDDPRAATGAVGLSYTSLGPAVQLGLHLHGGDGHEAAFVFATMATLRTTTDARLMLDAVRGVDARNTRGERAALGVNWAHGVGNLVSTAAADPSHSGDLAAVLLFVLPEQLEVTLERDTGSLREGATFSWGF